LNLICGGVDCYSAQLARVEQGALIVTMTMSPRPGPHMHDVYFAAAGGWHFYLRNPNHGIGVADQGLAFIIDGKERAVAWRDVAAVHLQIAALGNARNTIDQCKIDFADGSAIVVTNGAASGLPDAAQTPIYRDFVRDLHACLATQGRDAVRFSAGMAPWRYKLLFGTLVFAGLFFIVTPLGLGLFTGDWQALILAATGVAFIWPFVLLLSKSAPRAYRPDRLPDQLLS
jgi:hypothetical protein